MQNGYLETYLKDKGLEANTQALIYLAVSKKVGGGEVVGLV